MRIFLKFQNKELSDANLENGEQEHLEQQSEVLTHAEDIKSALFNVDGILSGNEQNIISMLKNASDSMYNIQMVYPDAENLAERLNNCLIELKDISREVVSHTDGIDYDPDKLQYINARLDTIYTLENKFHVDSVSELIRNMKK